MRAGMYDEMRKEQEAKADLQKALEDNPSNAIVLNELAWQMGKSDPTAALNYAEQAYRIAPANLSIIDTYASLLMATGANEQALNLLRQAHRQAPLNPTVHFRLASALAQVGQRQESAKELQALLAGKTTFPERTQAEDLLKKLRTP